MINIRTLLVIVSLGFSSMAFAEAADTILHNARIYTVNSAMPWATSVAITQGKFSYVGDEAGTKAHQGEGTRVIDMQGEFILPSFQDAHAHPIFGIYHTSGCPVFELDTAEAVLAEISRCVEDDPEAPYIMGAGWSWDQFPADAPPTVALLDAIDKSRPLVFGDADGHTRWLNSAALKLAGITRDTPDPQGGMIGRHEVTGEPNGLLMEASGMALITDKLPHFSLEQKLVGLKMAQDYFHSLGITAVQAAIVKISGDDVYATLPAYQALSDSGELDLRVVLAL